jgi:hypothetical protein
MAYTTTTRLGLEKAVPGSGQVFETTSINDNWDAVDAEFVTVDGRLDSAESRLTTAESDIDAIQAAIPTINTPVVHIISATSYSVQASDATDTLRFTSGSNVTVTVGDVLQNAEYINCHQDGAGKIIFVAGSGVTLQSPQGTNVRTSIQYGWASIIRVGAGAYRLIGNLESNA